MTLIVVFHIFLNAASATLTVKKHKLVEIDQFKIVETRKILYSTELLKRTKKSYVSRCKWVQCGCNRAQRGHNATRKVSNYER